MTNEVKKAIEQLERISNGLASIGETVDYTDIAIQALETSSCIKEKCAYCPHCEHCDVDDETLAIKALEQQLCEDCISREEAVEVIAGTDETNGNEPVFSGKQIIKMLKDLPPVTPKQKTGHWIKLEPYPLQMHEYECSECGNETDDNTESYCSECGAYMAESEDEG